MDEPGHGGTSLSSNHILLLGAIAGLTIFIGLPVGRARNMAPKTKAFLNATAIGILLFLLYDVLSHAVDPVHSALTAANDGKGSWWRFTGLAALFAAGLGIGSLGLVYYDKILSARSRGRPAGRGSTSLRPFGPGAASVGEFGPSPASTGSFGPAATPAGDFGTGTLGLSPARRMAVFIAVGIGLHNFAEGLAIGQSGAKGQVSLALILIIGFGLHNATEGFGIVAPLAAEAEPPSWGFLAAMGLIGGGPTFFGTLIGQSFVNDAVDLSFLALAAGSILYVIVQLLHVASRMNHQKELLMWGILVGLFAGFATDFVLVAAGV